MVSNVFLVMITSLQQPPLLSMFGARESELLDAVVHDDWSNGLRQDIGRHLLGGDMGDRYLPVAYELSNEMMTYCNVL